MVRLSPKRLELSLCALGQLLRSTCDLLAFAAYAVPMKVNPVLNYTLIIRSQVEYSTATQSVVLPCILETPEPANGAVSVTWMPC